MLSINLLPSPAEVTFYQARDVMAQRLRDCLVVPENLNIRFLATASCQMISKMPGIPSLGYSRDHFQGVAKDMKALLKAGNHVHALWRAAETIGAFKNPPSPMTERDYALAGIYFYKGQILHSCLQTPRYEGQLEIDLPVMMGRTHLDLQGELSNGRPWDSRRQEPVLFRFHFDKKTLTYAGRDQDYCDGFEDPNCAYFPSQKEMERTNDFFRRASTLYQDLDIGFVIDEAKSTFMVHDPATLISEWMYCALQMIKDALVFCVEFPTPEFQIFLAPHGEILGLRLSVPERGVTCLGGWPGEGVAIKCRYAFYHHLGPKPPEYRQPRVHEEFLSQLTPREYFFEDYFLMIPRMDFELKAGQKTTQAQRNALRVLRKNLGTSRLGGKYFGEYEERTFEPIPPLQIPLIRRHPA